MAALALVLPGCLPFAWATPPVQLEGSVGPISQQPSRGDSREVQAAFPLRASLHPLQFAPSWLRRNVDAGVGYQFVPISGRPPVHGPHIEVAYLHPQELPKALDAMMDGPRYARLGVHLKGHGLFPTKRSFPGSPAGTLQVSFEWFGFTDTTFSGCDRSDDGDDFDDPNDDPYDEDDDDDDESVVCGSGVAWGETAGGFFIEGSYGRLDEREHWWVGVGMKVRVPATLGVGFVLGDL